jgi:FMN reductase
VSAQVLVGNPRPRSRTLTVACEVFAAVTGGPPDATGVIDLADHTRSLWEDHSDSLDGLVESVCGSGLLVVASPTYKATFTGLLKAFLDRLPSDGLRGCLAIPVMTMESPRHSLAVDLGLTPLLVELGAAVPRRGLAFLMPDLPQLASVIETWVQHDGPVGPYQQP